MPLEATRETGGCERLFSRVRDRGGREWSIPLIPRVMQTTLRQHGRLETEPSAKVLVVCRHPYNRLVSAWRYLRDQEPWSKLWPRKWDEFLRELMDADPMILDRHLRPQVWFIQGLNLAEIYPMHAMGSRFQLKRYNQTPPSAAWPAYQKSYHDVVAYYAEDMALFRSSWAAGQS